ncbi:MAG: NADH-quinone oxidoreductase subunit N [bacterium]
MHAYLLDTSLSDLAKALTPLLGKTMGNFIPETILTAGFLFAILIDLFIRKSSQKKYTGYFVILVLGAAFATSWMQWVPYQQGSPTWKGGSMIFPYTTTLVPIVGMAVVDNFSVFFKLIISLSGIFVVLMSLLSREVEDRGRNNGEYFSLLLALTLGMFLMPAATDLVMMYIALELVSITSYIMAGFMKDNVRSSEASMKYVLFGAFSSGLMIYGFSLLYGMTGTTSIIGIQEVLRGQFATGAVNHVALWLAVIFSLAGMGYKISAAPFHFWTPDVYEGAPIPVTALLSVASKAGGFGLLMRFLMFGFPVNFETGQLYLNWPIVIAVLAAITMTLGNFAALRQSNIKRMLAYSTIAHAGYMMVGLVAIGNGVFLLNELKAIPFDPSAIPHFYEMSGVVSVMIYFVAYLFTNLGAFYVVMLIANKIRSEEIKDYDGFAKKSPLLAVCLSVFLVSLTGIPLTIGFIGKLYIFSAILTPNPVTHTNPWIWLAVVMVLNSVVSLYYYVRVMQSMFIKEADAQTAPLTSDLSVGANGTLSYSLLSKIFIFAFLIPTLFFGVFFQPVVDFASNVVRFITIQ